MSPIWILYGITVYFSLVAIYGAWYVPTTAPDATTHGLSNQGMWVFASVCFAICVGLIVVIRW